MLDVLQKRWFLVSLAVLIPGGLAVGVQLSADQVETLKGIVRPHIVTAVVLFLMSVSLNSRQLADSLQYPGPVLWAGVVNYGFIPLAAMLMMPWQLLPDFRYGLMIAASVPCTMAAASVWTRKARGNDAVSLLVTVSTNGLCFLITPFWLTLATRSGVQLDVGEMIVRLVVAVLIPTLCGQGIRLWSRVARFADRHKTRIGVAAQACILSIVVTAACDAGYRLNEDVDGRSILPAVLLVWGCCVLLHLLAMAVGMAGGRLLRFPRADRVAIAFASSQKTLPIGLLLATDPSMFGNPEIGIPLAVFPMLMYHASQLFIDTVVADRLAEGDRREENEPVQPSD